MVSALNLEAGWGPTDYWFLLSWHQRKGQGSIPKSQKKEQVHRDQKDPLHMKSSRVTIGEEEHCMISGLLVHSAVCFSWEGASEQLHMGRSNPTRLLCYCVEMNVSP